MGISQNNFPQAAVIEHNLPELEQLYTRYEKSAVNLKSLANEAVNFTVRVPLVGAFSCGKTTLVNALIGEKLFAVEVNPETALPVELTYAPQTDFTGNTPDGTQQSLTRQDVLDQNFSNLLPNGWLEAKIPAGHLEPISQLTLVDMPGWDSGIEQHSRAIDSYLYKSLAYCLVVSADEGGLRDSLRAFTQELAVRKMPAIVVITKSDKKPKEDVDAVREHVTAEISRILGKPPIGVVQVSARKREIQGFIELLMSLQSRAGERFVTAVANPILHDIAELEKRISMLLNQDNLDAEQLEVKRKELEQEMEQFIARVNMQTQELDSQLGPVTTKILQRIESSLLSQVDSLAAQAVNGGDIKGSIGTTLRMALAEGVEQEFAPQLHRYFTRIEQDVPESVSINTNINLSKSEETDTDDIKIDTSTIQHAISAILPMVLARVAGPTGLLVGSVISLVFSVFISSMNKKEKENNKIEEAKTQIINNVIPQVTSQINSTLRNHLKTQISEAKSQILSATEEQKNQYLQTLGQLEKELERGQAEFEKKREQFSSDLKRVEAIKVEISECC